MRSGANRSQTPTGSLELKATVQRCRRSIIAALSAASSACAVAIVVTARTRPTRATRCKPIIHLLRSLLVSCSLLCPPLPGRHTPVPVHADLLVGGFLFLWRIALAVPAE